MPRSEKACGFTSSELPRWRAALPVACHRPHGYRREKSGRKGRWSRERCMRSVRAFAAVAALCLLTVSTITLAGEPKQGGILRMYHRDSPGNASIHEGATYSLNVPFMPVFNNLVIYKQDEPQNSL